MVVWEESAPLEEVLVTVAQVVASILQEPAALSVEQPVGLEEEPLEQLLGELEALGEPVQLLS